MADGSGDPTVRRALELADATIHQLAAVATGRSFWPEHVVSGVAKATLEAIEEAKAKLEAGPE